MHHLLVNEPFWRRLSCPRRQVKGNFNLFNDWNYSNHWNGFRLEILQPSPFFDEPDERKTEVAMVRLSNHWNVLGYWLAVEQLQRLERAAAVFQPSD
jgi:hypothetical protein